METIRFDIKKHMRAVEAANRAYDDAIDEGKSDGEIADAYHRTYIHSMEYDCACSACSKTGDIFPTVLERALEKQEMKR